MCSRSSDRIPPIKCLSRRSCSVITPGTLQFVAPDWVFVAKFWQTDLSDTARLLHETFSLRGHRPWDPADLLRSHLLMLEVGEPSITQWVQQLQRCPLYAVLSGFEHGHTPGVGTFYGFFRRLWAAETVNRSPHRRLSRQKVKGAKTGQKAPTKGLSKIAQLLAQLAKRSTHRTQPFDPSDPTVRPATAPVPRGSTGKSLEDIEASSWKTA